MASLRPLTKMALPALMLMPGLAAAQDANGPEVEFYGQFNIGVLSVDDGPNTNTTITDNDNSNSRFGLVIKQGLNNGDEVRFHFETAIGLTGSSSISGSNDSFDFDYTRTELRKFELIYNSKRIGKFSFGQGSIATDGTAEADFSGTSVIAYSSINDQAGGQVFRLSDGVLSGVSVGSAFSALDGSRRFRARYDTPNFNGLSLGFSAGTEVLARGVNGEFYDIGLTYDKDFGDVKLAGRLGYSFRDSDEEFLLGSTSVLHKPTGLSLTVAAGQEQIDDGEYAYIKAGFQRDFFSVGRTHLSADYYEGNDFAFAGSDSSSFGVAVVQNIDNANLELYASYRTFELDGDSRNFNDLDVTFVGARFKF
ncbi:porin [Sulfitobacter sp.]|uniref:porin n=1 Tax=Sulfitobacter sp. TaxID=1903071 RepID=UPI00329A3DF9